MRNEVNDFLVNNNVTKVPHSTTTSSITPSPPSVTSPFMQQSTVTHYLHPTTTSSSLYTPPQQITSSSKMPTTGISLQPYTYPSNIQIDPNDIFSHLKLRKGKWTPEEENYANFLVREFENGTVPDCENGNTLRAFLSRKLHCAPMRISKKFAGKSIGKHVFIARISSITMDSDTYANRIKLRELEQAFLKSITEEVSGRLPLPIAQMMSQNNYPNHAYNVNNSSSSHHSTSHHHQQQGINNISTISVHNNKSTEFSTSHSHEVHNYYDSSNTTKSSVSPARSTPKNKSTQSQTAQTVDLTNQDDISIVNATNVLDNQSQHSLSNYGESLLPNGIMSMTDFLAGFDNVTNTSNKPSYTNSDTNSHLMKQQFSECQTTQSFDDLHKFLGKEIPTSSDQNNNGRSTITITVGKTKDGKSTCEASIHPHYDEKQTKISTSPGDNVLISDEGLVHNTYCSIVKTSYNCQDNDIAAPTLTTTQSNEQLNKKLHHKLDLNKISYDDYALFAQSACNGIRDYYYSSYKLRRPNHTTMNNKVRSSNMNTDTVLGRTKTAATTLPSTCLGKRSAADVSLLDM